MFESSKIDLAALRTGQALTIILLLVAFIINNWLLVAFVALAQLLGGLDSPFAPYRLFYRYILLQTDRVKPNPQPGNAEPHRFALLVGALFNGAGTLALLLGAPALGWLLVGIVIVLANLNFWLNFCLGCLMYYQFARMGVPGFDPTLSEELR